MNILDDRYITVAGIKTRYQQIGTNGPALVLVHGIASSIEDWKDNIVELSRGRRVIAFDLVGCGRSDKPLNQNYSISELAKFTLELMTVLGLDKVDLCGFSMGGRIALECAHMAPTRVRSLVISAPAGVGLKTIIDFRLATLKGIGELLTTPSQFGMRRLMQKAYANPAKITDSMISERLELSKLPGAQAAFLMMLRGMTRLRGFRPSTVNELHSWLPSISQPTLIVWGKQDRFLPVSQSYNLSNLMPSSTLKLYEDSGHLPHAEEVEKFNKDVLKFLEDLGE